MAVTFDAVGAGSAVLQSAGAASTFTITVAANAYVVLAACMNQDTAPTVTCGGVAMTALGDIRPNNAAGQGRVRLYGLDVPSAGSKTISLTSSILNYIAMNAVSYLGVGSVSTPATVFGTTGAMSQSGTCTTGQMTVEAFGVSSQSVATSVTSGAGGTSRYGAGAAAGAYLAIRDAAATTTFTGTASAIWAGLNVILSPSTVSNTGNFFALF